MIWGATSVFLLFVYDNAHSTHILLSSLSQNELRDKKISIYKYIYILWAFDWVEHIRHCMTSYPSVMNLVHTLPVSHHQRSPTHSMDSCASLQSPWFIALTIHTADSTNYAHTW